LPSELEYLIRKFKDRSYVFYFDKNIENLIQSIMWNYHVSKTEAKKLLVIRLKVLKI